KPIVFERQPEEKINKLLECVQYLHESVPPVIHRDLKPDNILLEHNIKFNRFIKLCDFGLATDHDIDRQTASRYDHTLGVGTKTYTSPEVYHYKPYNHKTDIYSLALIAEEIYSIDPQLLHSCQAIEPEFNKYYANLYQTLQSMQSSPDYKQRPDCREVLAKHNELFIDKTVVANHKDFKSTTVKHHIFVKIGILCVCFIGFASVDTLWGSLSVQFDNTRVR
ncbi:unnamed protein product, partial [Medioppia subpectinata]